MRWSGGEAGDFLRSAKTEELLTNRAVMGYMPKIVYIRRIAGKVCMQT